MPRAGPRCPAQDHEGGRVARVDGAAAASRARRGRRRAPRVPMGAARRAGSPDAGRRARASARSCSTVAQPIPASGRPASRARASTTSARTGFRGGERAPPRSSRAACPATASPTVANPSRSYRRSAGVVVRLDREMDDRAAGLERVPDRERRREGAEPATAERRPRPDRREVAAVLRRRAARDRRGHAVRRETSSTAQPGRETQARTSFSSATRRSASTPNASASTSDASTAQRAVARGPGVGRAFPPASRAATAPACGDSRRLHARPASAAERAARRATSSPRRGRRRRRGATRTIRRSAPRRLEAGSLRRTARSSGVATDRQRAGRAAAAPASRRA